MMRWNTPELTETKQNTLKNDTFDWLLKPIITTINIYRIADLQ